MTSAVDVVKLCTVFPAVCALIAADRVSLARGIPNLLCSVPRSLDEILKNPRYIFGLIAASPASGLDRSTAQFVSVKSEVGTDAEPDKNATVLKATFTYRIGSDASSTRDISVFIKLPTGRPVAVWIKGLGSAFAPDHREVAFYNRILPQFEKDFGVPFPAKTPRAFYASWSRVFDRAIVICDVIDTTVFKAIPDWQGLNKRQITAQLTSAAQIHAATWQIKTNQLSFIKERSGASWLGGIVAIFASHLKPWQRTLWDAVLKACACEPMVFAHADCRAGNMLFKDTKDKTEVVMTDWEACAITPYLWDFTYAITCGLTTSDRVAWADDLLSMYLTRLRDQVTQLHGASVGLTVPTVESARLTHMKMTVCIWYFGWVLTEVGGVGKTQGNSNNDMIAWRDRVHGSCLALASDRATFRTVFGVDDSVVDEYAKEHAEQLAKPS